MAKLHRMQSIYYNVNKVLPLQIDIAIAELSPDLQAEYEPTSRLP
jgi:hypothetical protein